MRSFKEELNKEIKTTEENQSDMLEIKNIGSQMKSPVESLSNLMDQGEDRRSVWKTRWRNRNSPTETSGVPP